MPCHHAMAIWHNMASRGISDRSNCEERALLSEDFIAMHHGLVTSLFRSQEFDLPRGMVELV
jgi:hypothetical protein